MIVKSGDKVYRVDEMAIVTRESLQANVDKAKELLSYSEKQLQEFDQVNGTQEQPVEAQPTPEQPQAPQVEQTTNLQPVEPVSAPVETPTLTVEPTTPNIQIQ